MGLFCMLKHQMVMKRREVFVLVFVYLSWTQVRCHWRDAMRGKKRRYSQTCCGYRQTRASRRSSPRARSGESATSRSDWRDCAAVRAVRNTTSGACAESLTRSFFSVLSIFMSALPLEHVNKCYCIWTQEYTLMSHVTDCFFIGKTVKTLTVTYKVNKIILRISVSVSTHQV